MVQVEPDREQQLNRVFSALTDPARRETLSRLCRGPATVGELSETYQMSASAFSKHLRVLLEAGLIKKEIVGRQHRCSLSPQGLRDATSWLAAHEQFWSESLVGLKKFLEAKSTSTKKGRKK